MALSESNGNRMNMRRKREKLKQKGNSSLLSHFSFLLFYRSAWKLHNQPDCGALSPRTLHFKYSSHRRRSAAHVCNESLPGRRAHTISSSARTVWLADCEILLA